MSSLPFHSNVARGVCFPKWGIRNFREQTNAQDHSPVAHRHLVRRGSAGAAVPRVRA
jgi:hypothetical protein